MRYVDFNRGGSRVKQASPLGEAMKRAGLGRPENILVERIHRDRPVDGARPESEAPDRRLAKKTSKQG